jgi:DNA-binding MarR family transcriptional regulator
MRHEERYIHAQWKLGKILATVLDEQLAELGITMPQFGVLNALAVEGALSGADLARRQDVRPQTMATTLNSLAQAGHIERRSHPVHGRVLLIELTDSGRTTWRAADERVGQVEEHLCSTLGDANYAEIRSTTWELVNALGGNAAALPPDWRLTSPSSSPS